MSLLQSLTPQEQTQVLLKHKQLFKQKFPRFDSLNDEEKAEFIIDHQEDSEELFVTAIQQTNPYVKVHTTQRTDSELGATGQISTFRTDSGATITTVTRLDSALYEKGAALAYSGQSIFNLSRQDCEAIDYYHENRPGAAKAKIQKGDTSVMPSAGIANRADASDSPSMARRKDRKLPGMDSPFTPGESPIQKATLVVGDQSVAKTTAPMSSMERRKNAKLPGRN